jgi:7-cyano-7-deazaguanine reductase
MAAGTKQKMTDNSQEILETFPNRYPGRDYEVFITCPEFTAVCPRTGQPDFATIYIKYVPSEKIVELKSLKLYLFSYREQGIFHEHVTNKILDDFVAACSPRFCEIVGEFNMRGGITTKVTAVFHSTEKNRRNNITSE